MALTKTQINYLTGKLERIISEKITNYRKKIGDGKRLPELIKEGLENGTVKLISQEEIEKKIKDLLETKPYYAPSINLSDLIPKQTYEHLNNLVDRKTEMVNEYTAKLYKIKEKALDSFVLKGVDIETVLAEFEEV